MRTKSPYSKTIIAAIRAKAMQDIPLAKRIAHIFPRAYCVAKPAPCCAVFATPWCDAEWQMRRADVSASELVREGVARVEVGDWCAIAYVATPGCGQFWVVENLSQKPVDTQP